MGKGHTPVQNPQDGWAEQAKIAKCAQKKSRVKKQPEPSQTHIEGQQRQRQGQHQAEQGIHDPARPGPPAAEHPQQVVNQAQSTAQGAGEQELHHLQRDRQFHQPNSRDQKLPPVCWSSS